jgi:tetratricopeptide (TPR) repeat protein
MINLGKSIDPPLARKSSVNVYYCLRPVVAYAFRFGEYVLTEKAISTFINTFTDRNGKLMFPYDMSLNAHIFIINNLMLQNKDDEARDAMEKFIELDPSISYSYYILALIYEKTNKQNEAFKYIEKAMKMDPYDEIYMIQYAKYLAKYYSISLADNFLKKRSQFLVSKRMLNTAKIVNYYNSCLFVAPEDDTAGDSHNLSIIDKYSLEVFQ